MYVYQETFGLCPTVNKDDFSLDAQVSPCESTCSIGSDLVWSGLDHSFVHLACLPREIFRRDNKVDYIFMDLAIPFADVAIIIMLCRAAHIPFHCCFSSFPHFLFHSNVFSFKKSFVLTERERQRMARAFDLGVNWIRWNHALTRFCAVYYATFV